MSNKIEDKEGERNDCKTGETSTDSGGKNQVNLSSVTRLRLREQKLGLDSVIQNKIKKPKRLLDVNQLAEYLSVSTKTIYGWIYRGIIEPERIGPRLIRFDIEKVDRWISSQKGDHNGN